MKSQPNVVGRIIFSAAIISILASGPSPGDVLPVNEESDSAIIGIAAGQSSVTANRIVLIGRSANGNAEALQAFQEVGGEASQLLAEIEQESRAGTPLSVTREKFGAAMRLIARALDLMREGEIEVNAADIQELKALLSVLDQKYYPQPSASSGISTR